MFKYLTPLTKICIVTITNLPTIKAFLSISQKALSLALLETDSIMCVHCTTVYIHSDEKIQT